MNTQTIWDYLFAIICLLVFSSILYLLEPILTPFLIAFLLAYLGDPLVHSLMRLHLPRWLSVVLVFLAIFLGIALLILLLIPLIQKQIAMLVELIPSIMDFLQNTLLPWISSHTGLEEMTDVNALKDAIAANWAKASSFASWLAKTLVHSGFALIEWLTNIVLIPVVTFYLLRDWDQVTEGLRRCLPRKIEPTVVSLVTECNEVLSAFFRGQLLVMISLGVVYGVGLSLIGLKVGLIIGLISGLMSIVPYLGFIVGLTTASVTAYIQFGEFAALLPVFGVFIVGQLLESLVLTPYLVGDRIGLHPVAVIFAILAGGNLFGFFGVLLALPAAAVIMVLIRFFMKRYQNSPLYQ
jgi:predicted PurR-regulated permease PerM